MTYKEWLQTATKTNGEALSEATIKKYYSGVEVISNLALENGIINTPLFEMELFELELAISTIFNWKPFLEKDTDGHHMYSNALKRYRCYKYLNSDRYKEEEKVATQIINDKSLDSTTKEMVVKARVGQGTFRDRLMAKYNGRCIITDLNISQALVASHIKPWAVCENSAERLSEDNGLLLSATYDRLFDSGLITFNYDGSIKLSSMVSKNNAQILNLDNNNIYDLKNNKTMDGFLDYHHKYVFIDSYKQQSNSI